VSHGLFRRISNIFEIKYRTEVPQKNLHFLKQHPINHQQRYFRFWKKGTNFFRNCSVISFLFLFWEMRRRGGISRYRKTQSCTNWLPDTALAVLFGTNFLVCSILWASSDPGLGCLAARCADWAAERGTARRGDMPCAGAGLRMRVCACVRACVCVRVRACGCECVCRWRTCRDTLCQVGKNGSNLAVSALFRPSVGANLGWQRHVVVPFPEPRLCVCTALVPMRAGLHVPGLLCTRRTRSPRAGATFVCKPTASTHHICPHPDH